MENEVDIGIPSNYFLYQNYPNPFNPVTKLNYELPHKGRIKIKLYDVSGREVFTFVDEIKSAGYYTFEFNAIDFSSGVYFYKLEAGNFSDTKRMIFLK